LGIGDLSSQMALWQQDEEQRRAQQTEFLLFSALPGGLISCVVHLVLLLGMGVYMLTSPDFGSRLVSILVLEEDALDEEDALQEMVLDLDPIPTQPEEEPGADQEHWDEQIFDNTDDLAAVEVDEFLENARELAPMLSSGGPGRLGRARSASISSWDGGLASRDQRRRRAWAYGEEVLTSQTP
jgi:hypothetical protein